MAIVISETALKKHSDRMREMIKEERTKGSKKGALTKEEQDALDEGIWRSIERNP